LPRAPSFTSLSLSYVGGTTRIFAVECRGCGVTFRQRRDHHSPTASQLEHWLGLHAHSSTESAMCIGDYSQLSVAAFRARVPQSSLVLTDCFARTVKQETRKKLQEYSDGAFELTCSNSELANRQLAQCHREGRLAWLSGLVANCTHVAVISQAVKLNKG
jgi:hypothetical protein